MLVEKLAFILEEKSHEFKNCNGKDLCLVCSGNRGSADLASSHLDCDPRQRYWRIEHDQDHVSWLIVFML